MKLHLSQTLGLGLLLFALACKPDKPDSALQDLSEAGHFGSAQTSLMMDGAEFRFTCEVSRDYLDVIFSPELGPQGISASAKLARVPVRSSPLRLGPIPQGVVIQRILVVKGDRVWVPRVEYRPKEPEGIHYAGARDGPLWEPGELVDLYAEVSMPQGPAVYLGARGLTIGATP
jgi:hypothetical protein